MNHTSKKILALFIMMLTLSLSACGRIRDMMPGVDRADRPTDEVSEEVSGQGFTNLVIDLRDAGAEVNAEGQIEQPFFPVIGSMIDVNGSSVQVFEFDDQTARQQVSDTISQNGDTIGTFIPSWIDQPNFWAIENLIVLYVGEDEALIKLLSGVLGDPITEPGDAGALPPKAVLDGQRLLAQELNVAIGSVRLVENEHVEWSDSCLGLGKLEESCLTVITPGWRAIFEIDGQRYEVRTDESVDIIRWQQLDGTSSNNKAFIYLVALESTDGEAIGCGDALIPVEIKLLSEVQPIKYALSQLLAIHEQYYGESGLYNALYQSDLTVDSVMVDSSYLATVNLSGELMLGGTCDVPRVQAQLERTVTQFQSVSGVIFFLNGKPLEDILSGAGQEVLHADYRGISFEYPSTLAGSISSSDVPASAASPGIPFISQVPEHIRIDFEDYADETASLQPQIRVVPVAALREIQPRAGNLIALLRTIMAIKPELLVEYIEVLPFIDTSDMMIAQIEAIDFQNGTGVRFLTQYNPGAQPITNEKLFYTFQGLTDDGKYFVAGVFPVSNPGLPETLDAITAQELAEIERDYSAYLADITRVLDTSSAGSFIPNLSVLDEMIKSLSISSAG